MDANEYYLNQHIKEVAESGRAQDWKDDYVDELISAGGGYNNWEMDNVLEAFQNMNETDSFTFVAILRSCKKLPANGFIQMSFAEHCIHVVEKYADELKKAAEKKADIAYKLHYQGRKYG